MTWKHFFTSSLGKKFVMGFTGFFLILFLIVHCTLNSMIFFDLYNPEDNGQTFNHWAHFFGTNFFIRAMEYGLFLGLLLHIIQGLILWAQNKKARPVNYSVTKYREGKWYSRSMGLLGTLILLFLILHLYHFWTPSRLGGTMGIPKLQEANLADYNNQPVHNLYAEMQNVFQNPIVVIIYILGVIALAWHLLHGFQSAFQTFGINHKKYTPLINGLGILYTIVICALFALMPVAFYFNWID
jgi:succinate dehydrogenase / fumarate reductase cytochrome b subunit